MKSMARSGMQPPTGTNKTGNRIGFVYNFTYMKQLDDDYTNLVEEGYYWNGSFPENREFTDDSSGWVSASTNAGEVTTEYSSTIGNLPGSIGVITPGKGRNQNGICTWNSTFSYTPVKPLDTAKLSFDRKCEYYTSAGYARFKITIENSTTKTEVYPLTDITEVDATWNETKDYSIDPSIFSEGGDFVVEIYTDVATGNIALGGADVTTSKSSLKRSLCRSSTTSTSLSRAC